MSWRLVGGAGAGLLSLGGLSLTSMHHVPPSDPSDIQSRLHAAFPLGPASRLGSVVAGAPLPSSLRAPFFKFYSRSAPSDTDRPLESYGSLAAFWARPAPPADASLRDLRDGLAAPCDGTVVSAGVLGNGATLDVGGRSVGMREVVLAGEHDPVTRGAWGATELHGVVIKVHARDDCLRVSSPTAWTIGRRARVRGGARWLEEEMAYLGNEREVLMGEWKGGAFGMVCVGGPGTGAAVEFEKGFENENACVAGTGMGVLRPQAAVCIIFEAPVDEYRVDVKVGDKVQAGQILGQLTKAGIEISEEQLSKNMDSSAEKDAAQRKSSRRRRRHW